jgi:hypothetical protein
MAITYQGAGAISYAVPTPSYPASIASGDLLVGIVGIKSSTATVTTPAGWLLVGTESGGGGTSGADTGPTKIMIFAKVANPEETLTGTERFSGTQNVAWAQIFRLSNATGFWDLGFAGGTDSTPDASWSVTCSSDPGITSGDLILVGSCDPTDTAHNYTSSAVTATGVTFGASTLITEPRSSSGQDIGGFIFRQEATAGSSSAAPVVSATVTGTTTNVRGPSGLLRIREVSEAGQPTNTLNVTSFTGHIASKNTSDLRVEALNLQVAGKQTTELRVEALIIQVMTSIDKTVYLTSIGSGEAFGSPDIATSGGTQTANPTGIASGEAFGSPTATSQASISLNGVASGEAFGAPSASSIATISATGVTSGEAFGSPALANQNDVQLDGIASAEAFGSPTVTATSSVLVTGIGSSEQFGSPELDSIATIQVTGIASSEAFGEPSLANVSGPSEVQLTGVPSSESFGSPTVSSSNQVSLTGLSSNEQFGAPTVSATASIQASGISSSEQFGSPSVASVATALMVGIASGESFGLPSISGDTPPSEVQLESIASAEAFGSPTLSALATVSLLSIPNASAFGLPQLTGPSDLTPETAMKVEFDVVLVDPNNVSVESVVTETTVKRATITEVGYKAST